VVSRYLAPQISVIAYDFEAVWAEAYRDRWMRYWSKYRLDEERTRAVTGFSGLGDDDEAEVAVLHPDEIDEAADTDPIERFLRRVRKGDSSDDVTVEEARECYYVGFVGPRYAYLTETYQIPVLTDLVRPSGDGDVRTIPRRAVRKLLLGDYVLFRDAGDSDVIALIAALEMGEDTYRQLRKIADQWREPLRSIGSSVEDICQRLAEAGLKRNRQTVRMWLLDSERIGPGTLGDLRTIARVSGDSTLKDNSERVHNAIRSVRGAHIQAGSTLSNLLLKQLPESTWEMADEEKHVDLGFGGGWVVCIEDIAEESEFRMPGDVNRLLIDEYY
jgi:hypothetical protein